MAACDQSAGVVLASTDVDDKTNEIGAHWTLIVKGNRPYLDKQLAGLPWKAVPDATRDDDRGHGRREIRTLKILTIPT
jgi:hypothetical protein